TYAAGLGALVLVAHLVVRRVAPYADPLLLPAVTALNGLGLVLIYRLDLNEAGRAPRHVQGGALRGCAAAACVDRGRHCALRPGTHRGAQPPVAWPLCVHGHVRGHWT